MLRNCFTEVNLRNIFETQAFRRRVSAHKMHLATSQTYVAPANRQTDTPFIRT